MCRLKVRLHRRPAHALLRVRLTGRDGRLGWMPPTALASAATGRHSTQGERQRQQAASRGSSSAHCAGVVENALVSHGTSSSTWIASTRPRWSRNRHRPASSSSSSLRSPSVLGIQSEQRQRTRCLDLRAHAEHERRADQVLERLLLADQRVADQLRADDRHRQLRAPHPLQRCEQRAADRVGEQSPSLVEGEQLQTLALGAHQVEREHRDQTHDLLPDALGLRVVGPRRFRAPDRGDRESAGR